MLQQTQVATVLPYYRRWLRRFPDFSALARARQSQVLHAWQGLGYYARARNLHASAKTIVERYHGRLPELIDEVRRLPGIGKYTAHALATFAFDQSVPIVEANTARVLARLLDLRKPIDQTAGRSALWNSAAKLVPEHGAARYNSALVDLGALVCLPRRPRCPICPVKQFCRAKNPDLLPVKKTRPRTRQLIETHAFVIRRGKILLQKSTKRWRGMWTLPAHKLDLFKRSSLPGSSSYTLVFPFTHHRVTLHVFRQKPRRICQSQQRWFSVRSLGSIPIPSPHRRAISAMLH
jgi:A/G-specific adenine glycosylase